MTKVKPKSPNRKKISWLLKQPFDVKAEMLKQHLEICRLLINELLDDEVIQLSGERYSRNKPNDGRYSRWGYNPGSVEIGDEKVRLEIPRVINTQTNQSQPLQSYEQLKTMDAINDRLMERVLLGLSTNDYAVAVKHLVDSFGLSRSSVSSRFIEQSESRLKEFMNRDLSQYEFVALFIDGKHLAKEQIIIVLGVTITGEKIPLGFIQTHSENAASIKALLTSLVDRGFDYEGGILCVIDGSKGIRKAVKEAFGKYALIQRCQWHKRENILSYLKESDQELYRQKIKFAYQAATYDEAKKLLLNIKEELTPVNISAANSLAEGLEETLTLHRLGIYHLFSRSFATTNCIESVNAHLIKYIGRVKYWKNSKQRYRWIACALLEIEQRMRKVNNWKKLSAMQQAIKINIGLIDQTNDQEAA